MLAEVLPEGLEVTALYKAPPFPNSILFGMGNASRYGSRPGRAKAREARSGQSSGGQVGHVRDQRLRRRKGQFFESDEEERFVLDEGPSEHAAWTLLVFAALAVPAGIGEPVVGVELAATNIVVQRAMQCVCACPAGHDHLRSRCAAELRREGRRLDFHLLHGVNRDQVGRGIRACQHGSTTTTATSETATKTAAAKWSAAAGGRLVQAHAVQRI